MTTIWRTKGHLTV